MGGAQAVEWRLSVSGGTRVAERERGDERKRERERERRR